MAVIIIDHAELAALAASISVRRGIEDIAEDRILPVVRSYISRPHPFWNGRYMTNRRFRNPPPGPVYKRTGDLAAGLMVEDLGGGEFAITSDAFHRGAEYAEILLDQGYEFIPPSLRARL